MNGIDWLPELLGVNPWGHGTYDMLYERFRTDFILSQLSYRGHRVWHFPDKEDGREAIFWHLTDREEQQRRHKVQKPTRVPDLCRSARLSWVRPMIENCPSHEILDWDIEEEGSIKTYVWLKSHDFLVLMKRYPDGARRLLTAYCLNYDNMREKLRKKYDRRLGVGT